MGKKEDKIIKRRLNSAYFTTVMSITLVLFSIGLISLLILNAKILSDYVKENINCIVVLNKDVKDADIVQIQKKLDSEPYVKSTEFITDEKAAETFSKDLGEDFVKVLGYNPLNNSIEIHFKADYATQMYFTKVENELLKNINVKEVYYQKSLVDLVNNNIKKISLIILGFGILLLIIAIALINNTIRLSIYSKRFIIKTMQLIGATESFIRKPFLIRSLLYGAVSSLLSIILLIGIIIISRKEIPDLIYLQGIDMFLILFGFVFICGLLISFVSTFFAIHKFLKTKTDNLYY